MALTLVQSVSVRNSSATVSSFTGSSVTVGSGTNRVLLILIQGYLDSGSGTIGASAVTHNGQSATKAITSPQNSRNWSEIWYIIAPTSGAGTTSVTYTNSQRATNVEVQEWTGADQTAPIPTTASGSTTNTTVSVALTTANNGSAIVANLSVESDETPVTVSAGGGTLDRSAATGTAEFNDVTAGVAHEIVATAGADGFDFSWSTTERATWSAVELKEATGATITGSGGVTAPAATLSGSGTVTVSGSGGVMSTVATLAGSGAVTTAGSGGVTAPVATVSGSGVVSIAGSGGVSIPVATLSGTGTVTVAGAGGVSIPVATVSGSGTVAGVVSGSGNVTAPTAAIAGSGAVAIAGSGGVTAPVATISGAGSVAGVIGGSGGVMPPMPTISGSGGILLSGSGSVSSPLASLSGIGLVTIMGSGGITAPIAALSGSGIVTDTGGIYPYITVTGNPDAPTVLVGNPDAPTAITGNPDAPSSITGDAAMDAQNLSGFTWGADLVIDLTAKNADGTALSSPGTQTIKIAIGATQAGAALLDFDDKATHSGSSVFRITIAPADYTATLKEGRPYYYTIWSQLGAASPIPQAKGTFTIGASVAAA